MAQVYYPRSTSSKYVDGAVAGLLGGGITAVVATVGDMLTPDRSWWTSLSVLGSIFTGASNFNTASTDWGSWVIGLAITRFRRRGGRVVADADEHHATDDATSRGTAAR